MAGYRIPINITLLVNTEGMSNQLRTKGRFGSKTVIRDRQLSTHSGLSRPPEPDTLGIYGLHNRRLSTGAG